MAKEARLVLRLSREERERIDAAASARGLSVTGFVLGAVRNELLGTEERPRATVAAPSSAARPFRGPDPKRKR